MREWENGTIAEPWRTGYTDAKRGATLPSFANRHQGRVIYGLAARMH